MVNNQTIQSFLEDDRRSKLREQIVEYRFLSDLFIYCAAQNKELELLKSEHDSFGYDIILKIDSVIKYIQLKSKKEDGSTSIWDIRKSLLENGDGTVILLEIIYQKKNIKLKCRILNKERISTVLSRPTSDNKTWKCRVNKGDLIEASSVGEIYDYLFNEKSEGRK